MLNAAAILAYTLVAGQGARLAGNPLACVFCLSLLEPIGVVLVGLRSDPDALWVQGGTPPARHGREQRRHDPGVSASPVAVGMVGKSTVRMLK